MIIAAFDMGTRNFAFCVEESKQPSENVRIKPTFDLEGNPTSDYAQYLKKIYHKGRLIECYKVDLIEYSKVNGIGNIYLALNAVLDQFGRLWDAVDIVLIEQQMAYGRNKANIQALRLAQHCLSYFYTIYGGFKKIIEWPSTHKTRVLGCPIALRRTHKTRKQFSIDLAGQILKERKDPLLERYSSFDKKDDISDCILMIQTYKN